MRAHSGRPAETITAPFWPLVTVTTIAWVVLVLWQVFANPRLLASWHGFLHAGIASRFPSNTWVPENPFFAGEVVAYYWVYQWFGYVVSVEEGVGRQGPGSRATGTENGRYANRETALIAAIVCRTLNQGSPAAS